jgi:hypothetical protein
MANVLSSLKDYYAPLGYDVRIVSAVRTASEQNALYAQGRTTPGAIVTNAVAGKSEHNYGDAMDIGLFDQRGNYVPESPLYEQVGRTVSQYPELEWGGNWQSIHDTPHIQLAGGHLANNLTVIGGNNETTGSIGTPPVYRSLAPAGTYGSGISQSNNYATIAYQQGVANYNQGQVDINSAIAADQAILNSTDFNNVAETNTSNLGLSRSSNNNQITIIPDLADINITSTIDRLRDSTTFFNLIPDASTVTPVVAPQEVEAAIQYRNSFKSGKVLTEFTSFWQTIETKYFSQTSNVLTTGGFSNDSILHWIEKYYQLSELTQFCNAREYIARQLNNVSQYNGLHLKFVTAKYQADTSSFIKCLSDSIGLLANVKYHQLDSTQPIFDVTQQTYGVPIPFTANMENKVGPTARNLAWHLSQKTTAVLRKNLFGIAYYNPYYSTNYEIDSSTPHGQNLVNDVGFFVKWSKTNSTRIAQVKNSFTGGSRLWSFIQYISNIGNKCAMNLRDVYAPLDGYDKDFTNEPGTTDLAVDNLNAASIDRQVATVNAFNDMNSLQLSKLYYDTANLQYSGVVLTDHVLDVTGGEIYLGTTGTYTTDAEGNVVGSGASTNIISQFPGQVFTNTGTAIGPIIPTAGSIPSTSTGRSTYTSSDSQVTTTLVPPAAILNDSEFQNRLNTAINENPGMTKEQIYAMLQGESGYKQNTVTGHYYSYFQLSPGEGGSPTNPTELTNASLADQFTWYMNYLKNAGYNGSQPIALYNAAPSYMQQGKTNTGGSMADPNTVIFTANDPRAQANSSSWGAFSNAGGAVTVGGVLGYYYHNTYGAASNNVTSNQTSINNPQTATAAAPPSLLIAPGTGPVATPNTQPGDKLPQPVDTAGQPMSPATQANVTGKAMSESSRAYSNNQRAIPFAFKIRVEDDINGNPVWIDVDYLLKKIVYNNINRCRSIFTLATSNAINLINNQQKQADLGLQVQTSNRAPSLVGAGSSLSKALQNASSFNLKNLGDPNNITSALNQLGINPAASGYGQVLKSLTSIAGANILTSQNLSQSIGSFIGLAANRLPNNILQTITSSTSMWDSAVGSLGIPGASSGELLNALNPFNYFDINIKGILPSAGLGSIADLMKIGASLATSGPPTPYSAFSQFTSIIKQLNEIRCNFELPFISWGQIEALFKVDWKHEDILKDIKDEFDKVINRLGELFDPKKIYEALKQEMYDYFKNLYNQLFVCNNKHAQDKSGKFKQIGADNLFNLFK